VVAAAVVQMHTGESVMELPIFAAAKKTRQKGHGSVLAALLWGLARSTQTRIVVVSATDESRAFWMKQACHTVAYCAPEVRTALRTLDNRGLIHGFSNSIIMARPTRPSLSSK
jgi:hypothetical protein